MQGEKRYEAGKSILLLNQGRKRREKREERREKRESLEILRFLFSKGELGVSLD